MVRLLPALSIQKPSATLLVSAGVSMFVSNPTIAYMSDCQSCLASTFMEKSHGSMRLMAMKKPDSSPPVLTTVKLSNYLKAIFFSE